MPATSLFLPVTPVKTSFPERGPFKGEGSDRKVVGNFSSSSCGQFDLDQARRSIF
jgi:hypothetical protein